jgi:3-phenylpropionate/trans-cinnamate dioxygenase ferredoxin component
VTWRSTGVAAATIAPGALRAVLVGATPIVLAATERGISALDASCPHLGGELADGTLADVRLTCPLHGAVFDARTGEVIADPFGLEPPEGGVGPVRVYPTRLVAGIVEVDAP